MQRLFLYTIRGLLLTGLLSSLAGLALGPHSQSASRPLQDPYLERQAAALRPEFQGDLAALAQAPRYTLEAVLDPTQPQLDGQMELHYTNITGAPLPDLVFQLLPNARSIYGGGSLNVAWAERDGALVNFTLSKDRVYLRVPLDPPLDPGAATTIRMAFTGKIPRQLSRGYGIYSQLLGITSLAGWYPALTLHQGGWQTPGIPRVGDAILSDISFFEVQLQVPEGYTVVATGTLLDRETQSGRTRWHLVSGPARDFAAAISQRFEHRQAVVEGVTLNFYSLPARRAQTSPERALAMTGEAITAYTRRFGPYPFTEFDTLDSPVSIGGYEFTGMIFVEYNQRVSTPGNYRYLLVHEIAHQWWYAIVGDNQITEPWLDEGFASYAAALYMEETYGRPSGDGMLNAWKNGYGLRGPRQPPVDTAALSFSNWTAYRTTVYVHGALFLDALRQEMGDERFFALLQAHFSRSRYQVVTTPGFFRLAEEIAGRDLDPLFHRWFD